MTHYIPIQHNIKTISQLSTEQKYPPPHNVSYLILQLKGKTGICEIDMQN